jgi:hypothetical protein
MTTKYNSSIFDSLKDSLSTKEVSENSFKDFMKFEPDKTYVVRLLPNLENTKRTRFHYFQHVFKSNSTGKFTNVLCPHTYGEKCPIDEYRSKVYSSKNDTLIEQTKPLKRTEKWLYNAYVISDPTNPDNQGQVKIINAGSQLNNIIQNAIDGDDKDEFGYRIFDLSPNGCNLRIKVTKNIGGWPEYVSSKFISPSEIDNLDDADEIYSQVKSLDTIFQQKSYDQIKQILDTHFFGKDSVRTTELTVDDDVDVSNVVEDKVIEPKSERVLSDHDKKMQDILKDL